MSIFIRKVKGFTLIELLVVVAIIGLLAGLILVSVQGSRLKAKDSRIQTALWQVRSLAEMSFTSASNYDAVCAADNTLSDSGDYKRIEDETQKYNGNQTVSCIESGDKQAYAVSSPMVSKNKHWCVSSVGIAKEIDSTTTISSCP